MLKKSGYVTYSYKPVMDLYNNGGYGMTIDAREHERCKITHINSSGYFFLRVNTQQFKLTRVENVSFSGTGVRLPVPLAQNTPVTLTYTEHDWYITVVGRVVWAEDLTQRLPITPGAPPYQIGIKFDPHAIEDTKMLFLALREHIDPFTWTS